MKLVGYLRVSTETQAEKGLGLEVQAAAIKTWAKANKQMLVDNFYRDEGLSGSLPATDRPGLAAALNAVQRGRANGLVVARLDRVARKLTVQEAVLARVWEADGHVFTVDSGEILRDDADDPMRTAMRHMIGVFAQFERGTIVARMKAGRQMKAAAGGYAFGAPPLGMAAEGGELVPVAAEQETLRRIADLRRDGRSLREIADTLTTEGRLPKRGARWHPETLRRVVARLDAA